MDETVIQGGQPYGGVTLLYRNFLKITEKIWLDSKRMCCIKIKIDCIDVYVFNIYMPCDVFDYLDDYIEVLAVIANYCAIHNVHYFVICGDLNTEFTRRNSCNTIAFSQFIADECLKLCLFTASYTFTSRPTVGTYSLIVHFIVTEGLSDYLLMYKQIESVDNLSDHLLHLNCNIEYANQKKLEFEHSPKWNSVCPADIDEYNRYLDKCLMEKPIPVQVIDCKNVFCSEVTCINEFALHESIVYSCRETTRCNISHTTKSKQSRCVPGWTAEHSFARDRSLFWHRLWVSNDKPDSGWVFDIMLCTRSKYHYMVHNLKRTRDTQIRAALGRALLLNGNRDYSRKLKKIGGKVLHML